MCEAFATTPFNKGEKTMKKLIKTFTALSFVFTASCGDDAEEIFNNATEFPEAQGESKSDCSALGVTGFAGISKQDVLILVANQTEFQTRYFSNANCAEADEVGRVTYQGEFAVDRTSPDSDANRGDITFEMEKAFVEVYSDSLIDIFNTTGFCGRSDYRKNNSVEVTVGSDNTFCPVSDVPAVLYGRYEYDAQNNTILLSADPVDMDFNQDVPNLPLIDVFASEFRKQ